MRRTAFIIFLLAAPAGVQAQGILLGKVARAPEVVVEAPQDEREAIPSQRLDGEELQRLNALSVADALRYFSGLQVKDYGGVGGLKTVNVRSLGSQHVGVFYDGVQLGNAQNGTIDLGRFSMDNMEAIDLYNGQKAGVLQTAKDYASASAVYLRTRRPQFATGRRDNLKLSLEGGSFGTVNPSVLWEHRLNKNLDAQVSTEYLHTTGRYRFTHVREGGYRATDTRRNGDVNALRAEGGLFGRLPQGEWQTKFYFYDSERGYPGAWVKEVGKFVSEDRQWDSNFFVQSSLRQSFGRYSLMLNAKYANDYLHYLANPEEGGRPANNRFRQQETYFSVANDYTFSQRWQVSLSADHQFNTLRATIYPAAAADFAFPTRHTLLAAAATTYHTERLRVQGSVLHTFVRDHTRTGINAGDKNRLTPALSASYRLRENLTLRAFYKTIYRMPTLGDNYYVSVGNAALKPERAVQYNLGAAWEHRWLTLSADAYYNEVHNKIVAMPKSDQFRWTMMNLGYVEIRGIDFAATAVWKIFRARLNYTYQKAQDFTCRSDSYYGSLIPYAPLHSGSMILGAVWRQWSLNYSFLYTGERWEGIDNIPANYALPWYTSDMSFSRTLGPWRLTAEVNNIFNQQYEVVNCYPMPGINFKLKAEITL
jgi:outer membrane cobalamin receptor